MEGLPTTLRASAPFWPFWGSNRINGAISALRPHWMRRTPQYTMPKKFHTRILEVSVTTEERLADLKRKFRARSGMREYRENCKALEAEIKRLEGFVAVGDKI